MLQIITLDDIEKWDEIVNSFNACDVHYLANYVKAFRINGEGEPILFYYNDDITRAVNVVIKRDIALHDAFKSKLPINTYFDLCTPYGYGGFLIEGESHQAVNEAYDDYCKEQGYVSEFVRFHLFNDFKLYYAGTSEIIAPHVVRSLEMPLDDMLMDFEHKVRKSLKKSARAGLEIKIETTNAMLEEFLKIYYGTMERSNAKEDFYFSAEFFHNIGEMKGNFVYFYVLYEGKVISTELVIHGVENCYSFLGGTDHNYFHLCANNFLKYEIIKWAKEKGLKRFVLGGGYSAEDGIFKYKKSYAPNGINNFYIGEKIFAEDKYKELLKIRRKEPNFEENSLFFPLYRR